jgi:hypothetical protein
MLIVVDDSFSTIEMCKGERSFCEYVPTNFWHPDCGVMFTSTDQYFIVV